MSDSVFKLIELTGTSGTSIEEAVQNALSKASKTLHGMRWFQVIETRGAVKDGKVDQWQVTIKVGFKLDE